jgi:hypothetical protein
MPDKFTKLLEKFPIIFFGGGGGAWVKLFKNICGPRFAGHWCRAQMSAFAVFKLVYATPVVRFTPESVWIQRRRKQFFSVPEMEFRPFYPEPQLYWLSHRISSVLQNWSESPTPFRSVRLFFQQPTTVQKLSLWLLPCADHTYIAQEVSCWYIAA